MHDGVEYFVVAIDLLAVAVIVVNTVWSTYSFSCMEVHVNVSTAEEIRRALIA
jgi:hypothetical protein